MNAETLYWILSTLPQVIGAMTALMITGITFFYDTLNKEVEKDESLVTIIQESKRLIFTKTMVLLGVSIASIINDIVLLGFTPWFASKITDIQNLCCGDYLGLVLGIITTLGLNLSSFYFLIRLLLRILNPDFQVKVNDSLAKKEKENLPDDDSVSPQDFIEAFIRFERAVRSFFPDTPTFRKGATLRDLVTQLTNEGILRKDELRNIQNIINKRNIYVHGGDIGRVSKSVMEELSGYIAHLERQLSPYLQERSYSRMEETFRLWISKYVDDFSEAYELDQAVRYRNDYGKFNVHYKDDKLSVYVEHGRPLYLKDEDSRKIFLDLLEKKYSLDPGMSIEDSASLQQAIDKDD